MYAAGVLPMCWIDGELFFLVGKDARDDTWSDFAGKCEKTDRDIAWTAAREFWEESYGVLVDAKTMRARLSTAIQLHGRTQNSHPYYCFLTEIPFVPHLRDAFRKHLAFMRQRNVHRMYIEKTDIVYVSLDELFSEDFPKRSVFKETLMHHQLLLRRIAEAGQTVPVTHASAPIPIGCVPGPCVSSGCVSSGCVSSGCVSSGYTQGPCVPGGCVPGVYTKSPDHPNGPERHASPSWRQ